MKVTASSTPVVQSAPTTVLKKPVTLNEWTNFIEKGDYSCLVLSIKNSVHFMHVKKNKIHCHGLPRNKKRHRNVSTLASKPSPYWLIDLPRTHVLGSRGYLLSLDWILRVCWQIVDLINARSSSNEFEPNVHSMNWINKGLFEYSIKGVSKTILSHARLNLA